jgi:hypothetical protein
MSRIRGRRGIEIGKEPSKREDDWKKRMRIRNSILFDGISFLFLSLRFPLVTLQSLRLSLFIILSPIHSKKKRNNLLESPFSPPCHPLSEAMITVVVFQDRFSKKSLSHLCYTHNITLQIQTRVKLNRVFFPRCFLFPARSPDSGFASVQIGTVGISLIHSCTSLIRWRGIWLP